MTNMFFEFVFKHCYLLLVCQLSVDFTGHHMSTTTADKVTCYLLSLCTAVDCCVEVTPLSRSFHLYLSIDPCNYLLRVGIDNFYLNQSLDRYTFGEDSNC